MLNSEDEGSFDTSGTTHPTTQHLLPMTQIFTTQLGSEQWGLRQLTTLWCCQHYTLSNQNFKGFYAQVATRQTLQHNMSQRTHLLWREGLRSSSKACCSGSRTVITRTIRGVRCRLSGRRSALPAVVWTAAWTGTKCCAGRGIWAQVAVRGRALTLLV